MPGKRVSTRLGGGGCGVVVAVFALATGGCGGGSDSNAPVACITPAPPSGFPGEGGLVALDGGAPSPFAIAPHRAWESLPGGGGAVDASPRIVVVTTDDDPLADTLTEFVHAAAESDWWPGALGEYGVGRPSVVDARGGTMARTVDRAALVAYVDHLIAARHLPGPAPETIHLVYLPPGVDWVDDDGENCGCAALGGEHMTWKMGQLAFVQRCSNDVDLLTGAASHEIAEAATNPVGHGFSQSASSRPWEHSVWAAVQKGANELGDCCEGTRWHEGGWTYQRIWSNAAAAKGGDPCAPPIAAPYFNVSTTSDWFSIPSGGAIDVEIDGWSDAPRGDWFVYASSMLPSDVAFVGTVTSDEGVDVHGTRFFGVNDGRKATLHVQAPSSRDAWAVLRIYSRDTDPAAGDSYHFFPVGLHVD